jgi:hypothetical protein
MQIFDPLIPHMEEAKRVGGYYCERVIALLEELVEANYVDDQAHPAVANYYFWRQQFSTNQTDTIVGEVPIGELWSLETVTFGKGGASSEYFLHGRPGFQDMYWEWETGSSVRIGGTDTPGILIPGGTKLFLSTLAVVPGGFGNAEIYFQFRKYRPNDKIRKRPFRQGRSAERYDGNGTHDMRDALVRGVPQAPPQGD